MRYRVDARVGLAVLSAAGLACGQPAGPSTATPAGPAIRVVAVSTPGADTVTTEALVPLVVSARDSANRPVPNALIQVAVVSGIPEAATVRLTSPASPDGVELIVANTDAQGEIRLSVAFGRVAGTARVAIGPRAGTQRDTVRVTITPGGAAHVALAPRDTVLILGSSFAPQATVTDRFNNIRTAPVTFSASSQSVTVSGSAATAAGYGQAALRASISGATDSINVTIVPDGTLAAFDERSNQIVLFRLDGSGLRALAPAEWHVAGVGIVWAPDGDRLYVSKAAPQSHEIFELDLQGHEQPVTPPPGAPLINALWPSVTHDGQWIYFAGEPSSGDFDVWRVHPDGTGLVAFHIKDGPFDIAYAPSVSPDGLSVAYATSLFDQSDVRARSLVTGGRTGLALNGTFPAWSPMGDQIAFLEASRLLRLAAPAGSGARTLVSTSTIVIGQIGWSPDGAWIVYRGDQTLELVAVATGLVIPLPFAKGVGSPAWRPVP